VVCGQEPPQRGILLPLMHYLVVADVRGTRREWLFYNAGMSQPHQWKFHTYCLKASSGGFEYGKIEV